MPLSLMRFSDDQGLAFVPPLSHCTAIILNIATTHLRRSATAVQLPSQTQTGDLVLLVQELPTHHPRSIVPSLSHPAHALPTPLTNLSLIRLPHLAYPSYTHIDSHHGLHQRLARVPAAQRQAVSAEPSQNAISDQIPSLDPELDPQSHRRYHHNQVPHSILGHSGQIGDL